MSTCTALSFSGVLQELGSLDLACVSQREAERYVVKMDQSAQARIDNLIQEAHSNSYTLYILVHDHAHWDISRCVCEIIVPVQQENQQSNQVCLISVSLSLSVTQCILQQLRQWFGSGGPAVKLPTGQRCSKHPSPPRYLLPFRSSDTVHPHQPLQ